MGYGAAPELRGSGWGMARMSLDITTEKKSLLMQIKENFGLPSLTAAIWFAVTKLVKEIGK